VKKAPILYYLLILNTSVMDRRTDGRTKDRRQWYHRRLQHYNI